MEEGLKILMFLAVVAAFTASAWVGYAHEIGAMQ